MEIDMVEAFKISIHALRKECDGFASVLLNSHSLISIHALRKECDRAVNHMRRWTAKFLSTHSVRSATYKWNKLYQHLMISIHALRKECDQEAAQA